MIAIATARRRGPAILHLYPFTTAVTGNRHDLAHGEVTHLMETLPF